MTLTRVCILIALLPVVVGLAAAGLHSLLGCTGGAAVIHCRFASDAVGNALAGFSWLVLGFLLSFPLAVLVAVVGKLAGYGRRQEGHEDAA